MATLSKREIELIALGVSRTFMCEAVGTRNPVVFYVPLGRKGRGRERRKRVHGSLSFALHG